MTRIQYASTLTPPPLTIAKVAGAISSAKAGTKNLWLVCRCRAGYTLFSSRYEVAIAEGEGLDITIPAAARQSASEVLQFLICMAESSDPTTACVVGGYPGYISDSLSALPTTITLDRDEHFELSKSVTTAANLPTTDALYGMRRYVDDEALIKEYDSYSLTWKTVYPQEFNPYLTDSTGDHGADRDIANISDSSIIVTQDYDVPVSTESPSAITTYWMVNDEGVELPSGTRIRVSAAIDSLDIGSDDLISKLELAIAGYVNLADGSIDTTGLDTLVTGFFQYQGDKLTNLRLPKPLPNNYGVILQIRANFTAIAANSRIARGSTIKFTPRFDLNPSEYNPLGQIFDSFIFPDSDRRRVVPDGTGLGLLALNGSGLIREYSFRDVGQQVVPSLAANTDNQKLLITVRGVVYPADTIPVTAEQRAIAGTINGAGLPSGWQAVSLDNTKLLEITVTHPTMVRSDYPDAIASTTATLNASQVRVYVRPAGGGTITSYDVPIVGTSGEVETITVGGDTGVSGATLQTQTDFGLFTLAINGSATPTGTSTFAAGNYEWAIAYLYENAVTRISHSVDEGCVPEDLPILSLAYWQNPVHQGGYASLEDAIRNIPETTVFGFQSFRDGAGRLWYYDPNGLESDNGTTVLIPTWKTTTTPGRFKIENYNIITDLEVDLNTKIDTLEVDLNTKIDTVESTLIALIFAL